MTLIEGVGDEVTYVAIAVCFVTSLIASIQLFPGSVRYLQSLYASYFQTEVQSEQPGSHPDQAENEPELVQNHQDSTSEPAQDCSGVDESAENHAVNEKSPSDLESEQCTSEGECKVNSESDTVNDDSEKSPQEDCPVAENTSETLSSEEPSSSTAITVRLKYLNDTERTVTTEPTETVGNFKRNHFVEELSNHKIVRLIFNGQLLRDERTVESYGIVDGTVVHVQISQRQTPQPYQASSNNGDLDISNMLWPSLSVALGALWVLFIRYPEYFTVSSTVMLTAFSASFVFVYVRLLLHSS